MNNNLTTNNTQNIAFSFQNNQIQNSSKIIDNGRGYQQSFFNESNYQNDLKRQKIIQKGKYSFQEKGIGLQNYQISKNSKIYVKKSLRQITNKDKQDEQEIQHIQFKPQLKQQIQKQQLKSPQKIQYFRPSKILNKSQDIQNNLIDLKQVGCYEGEVLLYRKGTYIEQTIALNKQQIILTSIPKIFVKYIKQVKVYPEIVKGKSFKFKIIHKDTLYLGIQLKRQLYYLPQQYIWFAKIINAKLLKLGIQIQKKDGEYLLQFLSNTGTFIEGYVYKKSKYLKKWQKRYLVINTQGLFSYKSPNQNYTICIALNQFKQLWTEFQIFQKHLVIKFNHKAKGKFREHIVQLAIPIIDFCLRQEQNWLFALYRIIFQHKIHIKNY